MFPKGGNLNACCITAHPFLNEYLQGNTGTSECWQGLNKTWAVTQVLGINSKQGLFKKCWRNSHHFNILSGAFNNYRRTKYYFNIYLGNSYETKYNCVWVFNQYMTKNIKSHHLSHISLMWGITAPEIIPRASIHKET